MRTCTIPVLLICCFVATAVSAKIFNVENSGDFFGDNDISVSISNELFVDDCTKVTEIMDDSLETIFTTAEVVHSCSKELTRVLNPSKGAMIIIGAEKSAVALACLSLDKQSDYFYNKYYVLPKNVKTLQLVFDDNELALKVYTTSHDIINRLVTLVRDSKYNEAVEVSKYIYNAHSDGSGKTVIIKAVNQLIDDGDFHIMNYAFKLMDTNENIVENCFPRVFIQIFKGDKSRILDKERTGVLRLSTKIDYWRDRWLYKDCTDNTSTDEDVYWKFVPTWNTTLNSVVFKVENIYYGMRLKLDKDCLGLFSNARLTFGDFRAHDSRGRYAWRLLPTGFNARGETLFYFIDVIYSSCLSAFNSEKCNTKVDILGIKRECTPDMGWIIETYN